ncbi:efflux RND transporter periplasmic adaptor subunit [Sphingobacterium sp. SGL-16]|uniref:efflux RND transporter periplasmic adaptor subunit n=1 Tax=Sphingobacterium sp. SGL-16 TaxID=2710883 RepID=UPI0013ED38B7|nr:efflux RND transporter periplasmic adaptor subunit [Sphingobacterium sp. SGL-16]NGM73266.1 biotin/lipoyl-binding protein [Sphingobacterium sp. SGL-16]
MKKIINNLCLILILGSLAYACSSDKKENENSKTNEQILQEVNEVKAIGKVVPAEDYAIISSATAGRIAKLFVQEGDSVQKDQILFELEYGNSSLDVKQATAQLNSLRAQNKTIAEDIAKAEIYARELKEKYETSKLLVAKNAETKEKLETDYSNWQQQEANLRGLRKQLSAQKLTESEQQIQINKAQNIISDFTVKAASTGIITDLTAKLGQSIGSSQELGKIINIENPIIEAEVDELFANDIQFGQKVIISPVGRKDTLGQGTIFYANPILSNKSILYESANEGEDRRVRKIKIRLDQGKNLTINAKVDCSIRIR